MPKYLVIGSNGLPAENPTIATSAGAADAGKIPELGAQGKLDNSFLPDGLATPKIVVASEALTAGNLVNLHNNSGALAARKADASGGFNKAADGFILSSVASGANALIYFAGGVISGLSGLTPGNFYFLGATGGISLTPPATAGHLVQIAGKALSATELVFEPQIIATRG